MPKQRIIGFYHRGDLDGLCSGAILKKVFGDKIKLYGVEYGEDLDTDAILQDDDLVYIADYSFEPFSKMLKLNEKVRLIWIDHHITSLNEMQNAGVQFKGVMGDVKNSKSAAHLAWEYFFPMIPIPKGVKFISLFDTWQHEFKKEIMDFCTGLTTEVDSNVNSKAWDYIFNDSIEFIQDMKNAGDFINKHIKSYNKQYALEHKFESEFEGYKAVVINKGFGGSMSFDAIWDESKYDLMIAFSRRNNKKWKFHLYTTKNDVDCSEIAKKWGGGGHRKAAGFELTDEKLPFKI